MPRPTPLLILTLLACPAGAQEDVADVASEARACPADAKMVYHLMPPAAAPGELPEKGCGVWVVLPGGDGSADFLPFVKRMKKNALPADWAVVQLVAPTFGDGQQVVWPTERLRVAGQTFSTEQFVRAAVEDATTALKEDGVAVDPARVAVLGWSSGGPPAYAALLDDRGPAKGAFVMMSVYKPAALPPAELAAGKPVYIEHGERDFIPMRFPEAAAADLKRAGATVKLATHPGGHGFGGDAFGRLKAGAAWVGGRMTGGR